MLRGLKLSLRSSHRTFLGVCCSICINKAASGFDYQPLFPGICINKVASGFDYQPLFPDICINKAASAFDYQSLFPDICINKAASGFDYQPLFPDIPVSIAVFIISPPCFIPCVHFVILSYCTSPVSVPICSFDSTRQ